VNVGVNILNIQCSFLGLLPCDGVHLVVLV